MFTAVVHVPKPIWRQNNLRKGLCRIFVSCEINTLTITPIPNVNSIQAVVQEIQTDAIVFDTEYSQKQRVPMATMKNIWLMLSIGIRSILGLSENSENLR